MTVQIGGGYTWTLSDVRDYLGDGYNFNIGVTWEASPAIGVEGLYSFNGLGTKDFSLPVASVPGAQGVPTPFTADMNMQYGTASLVFKSTERQSQAVWPHRRWHLPPPGDGHDARYRLRARVLQPVVVLLCSRRIRPR